MSTARASLRSSLSGLSSPGKWALGYLCLLVFIAVIGPSFTLDQSPNASEMELEQALLPPMSHTARGLHVLGTDKFGRDQLSRIVLGSRISLSVAVIAVGVSFLIGIPIGLLAGYYGGKLDAFLSWVMAVLWSVPTLLLVIALTFVLGKGLVQVFLAVGLTMWVEVARVVRGQVMAERHKEYIQAAQILNFSTAHILFRELLPNVLGPIYVISAANAASALLIESGLSFLGIGAQPPTPSWGSMIRDYYPYIITGKAYLSIVPGILIAGSVLSLNTLSSELNSKLGRS